MSFQTLTIPALSVTKTADEWRAVLVDATAFQDELRAALANQRAANDDRPNLIALNGDVPLNGKRIARATKKQNKHLAEKRFLAKNGTGAFSCPFCPKRFNTSHILAIHKGRMHKAEVATGEYPNVARVAADKSAE